MPVYSHSKLNTFKHCPRKFKYKYIDQFPPEIEKTIEAHLGRAVHSTLEWIYNVTKKSTSPPTLDEAINYYFIKWQDEFSDEVIIVKKELTEKDYFNKGVRFVIDYYSKHFPFKDGTIECEKKVSICLSDETGEKKYLLKGFIDRLVYNTETGEYEIHDYKTGNNLPNQNELDEDNQLALYSLAIKEIFGEDKKIILVWHFLAHNVTAKSERNENDLKKLKNDTIKLIEQIEQTKEFPPNFSPLCNWCEYRKRCFSQKFNEKNTL